MKRFAANAAWRRLIGVVSSDHTIIEIGADKTVELRDVAALVGPDRHEILPGTVAGESGSENPCWIMTKPNALLRLVVV